MKSTARRIRLTEQLLDGPKPRCLVGKLGALVVVKVVTEPVRPGVQLQRRRRGDNNSVRPWVVEGRHRQPPSLATSGDAVQHAPVGPAAHHLHLVPDVDEDPTALGGPHGDPLYVVPQELQPAHDVVLQEQDDAACVGVGAEAPHEVWPRARRVHGELGPDERRREGVLDAAAAQAEVQAHALAEPLGERHHLADVHVDHLPERDRQEREQESKCTWACRRWMDWWKN